MTEPTERAGGVREAAQAHYSRVRERVGRRPDGSMVMPEWDSVAPEIQAIQIEDIRAIAAALPPPAAPAEGAVKVKDIVDAWSFLQDRLLEFEQEIGGGEEEREWAGHVHPAMSRFNTLIAALTPAGWKLVPIEPTREMVEAGTEARWRSAVRDADSAREIYTAMLAAAKPA